MSKAVGKFNAGIKAKAEELKKKAGLPEAPKMPIRPNGPADVLRQAKAAPPSPLTRTEPPVREMLNLKASLCIPSEIKDRLDVESDPDFEALKESIREEGQKVPILVRPHPTNDGFYEIAYGRRRWRACVALGLSVLAVVDRELSNEALVIAQGKENYERKNLSFIETALFVHRLSQDYPNQTVAKAIGASHQSSVSHYRKVVSDLSETLIKRIGPAPKMGRRKWVALADLLETGPSGKFMQALAGAESSERWRKADSNVRFEIVLGLAERQSKQSLAAPEKHAFKAMDGKPMLELSKGARGFRFAFKGKNGAELSAFIAARIPELIKEFEKSTETET